ncbi:HslU--HslV peptidase ATPase subunit [Oceanidesulfovibrio indonesiensis]|uniref:ATP-dependent protease ATPase subunit HslU n=1 Tax=Oceanidesulfovibrio indonesiensis TaxID=54767 RepID=A0A7M3MC82_9BACT|nr:ATP-dependent protease ATPase subunit HslU [Oceanidesulfovibrio indonesiensis]TVM15889.1 HslU--HslV peptidase ATPase subunit [Oceanidesulfovibrio indonesiensis]
MDVMTPREIVAELDKYIVGQAEAKRMVAIAMRNRWRRRQLDPELREEIAPKNIIMIGPTGVGKTEIARRLAKLAQSPFFKVEATKFTEVGYVGRDVESMVRDLMEIGVSIVKDEEEERVKAKAEQNAEERLLDLLLPKSGSMGREEQQQQSAAWKPGEPIPAGPAPDEAANVPGFAREDEEKKPSSTREKLRKLWRDGYLDDRQVEMEVTSQGPQMEIMAMPGMEEIGFQFKDMMKNVFPQKKKRRSIRVKDAYELLVQEEAQRLVDMDKVTEQAKERVEQDGIIFIDEIDKIVSGSDSQKSGEVSREGVQRDLLPIVEGSTVNTKHGMIRTDHILFIAAGAFHTAKPSDLVPELQGRFPLRVELSPLDEEDFYRILTEPRNALTKQYVALLGTEDITVEFSDDAIREIASFAARTNEETDNIGARRLYTIIEKVLTELSFEAPEKKGQSVTIDAAYVREHLADVIEDRDLSRYIL